MPASLTFHVSRTTLPNGLRILVKENHATPVAAVLAHVKIGYFNEIDKWNGLSHVIEHMFFKGTEKRPGKEQIAEEIRSFGGSINAGTYYDQTSYYIVTPSEHVEKAIEIESDMFLRGLFDADELARELEVIIQESHQNRDRPTYQLLQSLYAQAYDEHRIRRWRIGSDETLRSFRREDILQFVEQTYRPENIVLTIVGDVQADEAIAAAERYWGQLPKGNFVRDDSPVEPVRTGFRWSRMKGAIEQRLVEIGFPAPPILHKDAPALSVLGSLLSDGRSARLHQALKEKRRIVNSVWAGYEGFEDLGLFTSGAEAISDDPLEVEQALFSELARISKEPAAGSELARIKTRMESRQVYAEEEVLGIARNLAYYESLGDYHIADLMLERLKEVTPGDIERVGEEYLRLEKATILEYLPNVADAPERSPAEVEAAIKEALPDKSGSQETATSELFTPIEKRLYSGAALLFKQRTDLPIVALYVLFPGGKGGETRGNCGITNLMLKSALKGTKSYSALEISDQIESLGSGIGLSIAADYFGFSMKILSSRLPEGLKILQEVISSPTFDVAEVEKEKQSIYGEIRRQQDNMSGRAIDLLNRAMYGDQPYGLPSSGIKEAVEGLTPDDLRDWHQRWVRSSKATVAVVGDIEQENLEALLANLVPEGKEAVDSLSKNTPLPPQTLADQVERKQTAAVMGFPGTEMDHEDRYALDLLAEITSGQAGRFFQAVRGDNGLAYVVSSFHRSRKDGGAFITYTATAPDREELAREILLSECARLTKDLVDKKELKAAKVSIRGEHIIGTQTFSAQAGELAVAHLYGQPLDYSERYLDRIDEVTAEQLRETAQGYLKPDTIWQGIVRGTKE